MTSYYCNDLVLHLPDVQAVVDASRHCLKVVTTEGVELELVIERALKKPQTTVASIVEASVAERRRSLRGFEVESMRERSFPEVTGVELYCTYIDRERGPLAVVEFHTELGDTRISYECSCRVAQAATCQQWMEAMLEELTLAEWEE
jgi:hypothetical protein